MSEDAVKNWLSLSQYDIDTAKAMLEAGRYLYVVFTCQQAVEKMLKAIYIRYRKKTPPYTHNLLRLVAELNEELKPNAARLAVLEQLNSYYIESRYSEEYEELALMIDHKKAATLYRKTLEILSWLRKKMT